MMKKIRATVGGTLLGLSALSAIAQGYPHKPIRIIVPGAVGTITDLAARAYAEALQRALMQSVVVINRPGAAGIPAAIEAARAAPDGYTLLLASTTTLSTNPLVYKTLPYDPDAFVPLWNIGYVANVLTVTSTLPVDTLDEFIAYARTSPNKLTFGTSNMKNLPHIAMLAFAQQKHFTLFHIPYTGQSTTAGVIDAAEGRIDAFMDAESFARPFIAQGKLKVIAVATAQRLPAYPGAKAFAEVVPGFKGSGWLVLVAPRGMPEEAQRKLNTGLAQAMKIPDVAARMTNLGFFGAGGELEQVRALYSEDRNQWQKQIADAGILPE